MAKNWTLEIVAPGVEAEAEAVTVVAEFTGTSVPPTGPVMETLGEALMVTETLLDAPILPRLSVPSAVNV